MKRLVLLMMCSAFTYGYDWTYKENWSDQYPTCGHGKRQSPITIIPDQVVDRNMGELVLINHEKPVTPCEDRRVDECIPYVVENDGRLYKYHMRETEDPADQPRLQGGPLPDGVTYVAREMHWHWGADNTEGCEHILPGVPCFSEFHVIYTKIKYKSLEKALKHKNDKDAIAIVAASLIPGDMNSHGTVTYLSCPLPYGDSSHLQHSYDDGKAYADQPRFPIRKMLPDDLSRYYSYRGSIPHPPCTENGIWIVVEDTYPVASSIFDAWLRQFTFRDFDENGNPIQSPISGNFRPPQPINCRHVYRNNPNASSDSDQDSDQDESCEVDDEQ